MAHVAIVSAAYWGDVMPLVPIADELIARGHRVSLVVPRGFHDVLAGHGELVHLGTDFSPRELAEHGDVMERATTVRGMRAAIDLWIGELVLDPIEDILEVLDGVAPDVWLVHNTVVWLVELVARPAGTPVVAAHLFPMMIPSSLQAPPTLPLPGKGIPVVNRFGWRVGRAMTARQMFDDEVNALRRARGLPDTHANVAFSWERADRVLLLSSEAYWPRPLDWPARVVHTGFTVWGSVDDPLPPGLATYLDAGPPPVVVTLGTSAATNARDAFELAADAIGATGRRPLLLVGNDRNVQSLADRGDVWEFASLPAVLTRSQAIVHAAGHGTTAAALHAGVPQVVLPQVFDQVGHAQRLVDLGVGVHLPWRRRRVDRLVTALTEADGHEVRARATVLAKRLANEDGPAVAAGEVEQQLLSAV